MHHNDHHPYVTFSLGVLAGSLIGAGVALLMAPKTGAQMREDLSDSVNTMRQAAARRIRALADRAGAHIEDVEAAISDVANAAEATALDAIDGQGTGRRRSRSGSA